MKNSLIVFAFFLRFFRVFAADSWFTAPCPADGVYSCTNQDNVTEILNDLIVVSNCEYFACPPIFIVNCTVQLENITFTQPRISRESALTIGLQSNGTLTNLVMTGCTTDKSSGACMRIRESSNIVIKKASFSSFMIEDVAGVVFIQSGSSVTCTSCFFRSGTAGGSAVEATGTNTLVMMQGGGCSRITGISGACLKADDGANIIASDIQASNLNARVAGSVAYASNGARIELHRSTLTNNTSGEQAGCTYAIGATVSLFNSIVVNCSCYGRYCFGGMAVMQNGASMSLENTTMFNIKAERYAGLLYAFNDVSLRISRSRINQTRALDGDGGAIMFTGINCRFISVNTEYSSCYASGKGGALILDTKDYSTIRDNTFTNCSAGFQAGAVYLGRQATGILSNSRIIGCRSSYGGAIMVETGKLDIENTTLIRNSADSCGGAIYLQYNGKLNITKSIRVSENTALSGNAFCLTLGSVISSTVDNYVNGTVFTDSTAIATAIQPFMKRIVGSISAVGPPSRLRLLTRNNISLLEGDRFPQIDVQVKDFYENDVIPDYKNVVIVQLTMLNNTGNANIIGDRIKAYVDPVAKRVSFKNWTIQGKPGNYSVRIIPFLADTFDPDSSVDYPSINVTMTKCEFGSWQASNADTLAKCLRPFYISTAIRSACLILGLMGTVFVGLNGLVLFLYREFPIVKKSQHLLYIGVGLGFSFTTVATQYVSEGWTCYSMAWLENIGLLLVMLGILFKILLMAQSTRDTDVQDNSLKNTLFLLVLAFILLSVWTGEDVKSGHMYSNRISTFRGDEYPVILLDECIKSGFYQAATFIRVLLTLATACVCWNYRDLNADSELIHLGMMTYNWIFFGSVLSLIAEYAVADPDVVFVLKQASILIPSFICTLGLLTYKVWICWTRRVEWSIAIMKVPDYQVGKSTMGDSLVSHSMEMDTMAHIKDSNKEGVSFVLSTDRAIKSQGASVAVESHYLSKRGGYTREASQPPSQI